MSGVSKRTLMLAVALVAVVAGVLIVTLSGGHSHNDRSSTHSAAAGKNATQAAAAYLGLGTAQLRRRLRNGETLEQVAESTPGHSARGLLRTVTDARAEELRKQGLSPTQIRADVGRLRARLRLQLRRQRRAGAIVGSASHYLGIDEAELRSQLRSGKTLVQIAAAHGRSRAQLVEGLVRVRKATLIAAREHGEISAAEERNAIRLLRRKVARVLDTKTR